jgi:hypothetical protein
LRKARWYIDREIAKRVKLETEQYIEECGRWYLNLTMTLLMT